MEGKPSYIRPAIQKGKHPVETTRYIIGTQVIKVFQDTVCRWIDNRFTGGIVYGEPRRGKTNAIKYLCTVLPSIYQENIPVISLSCRDYRNASESVFFEELLEAAGHSFSAKGTASAKRNRLKEFLFEIVERSEQDRIIFLIDEAQHLHESHYKWLIDLHNELYQGGISCTVLLVGQPKLCHQFSAFKLTKKSQIIGRFMAHQHSFEGIQDLEAITTCLSGYDEGSEYPENSGWSFTKYFFPAAFMSDWRLADSSEDLWIAFLKIHEECGLVGAPNIPMQFFCRTVEYVLKKYGSLDESFPALSVNIWKEAIRHSGYIEAEACYAVTA